MHPQSHIYHFSWNPALLDLLFCYGGETIHTAFLGKLLYLYSESHLLKDVTPAMDPFQPYIISMSSSAGLSSSSSSYPNATISPILKTHKIFWDIKSPLKKPPGFPVSLCKIKCYFRLPLLPFSPEFTTVIFYFLNLNKTAINPLRQQ